MKEIAKSIVGAKRMHAGLLVVAPQRGSVRVILRAPEAKRGQNVLAESETAESIAVRRLASVIEQSDNESDDSPLTANLQSMNASARTAVSRFATSVIEGSWQIDGKLRQKGVEAVEVRMSPAGAKRLRDAATVTDAVITRETRRGHLDGQRRSLAAMWFIEEGRVRSIGVSVPNDELMEEVAELSARNAEVSVDLLIVTVYAPGDTEHGRSSYGLEQIRAVIPDQELPLGPS